MENTCSVNPSPNIFNSTDMAVIEGENAQFCKDYIHGDSVKIIDRYGSYRSNQ